VKELGRALLRWAGPPVARLLARSWRIEVVRPERGEGVFASGHAYLLLTWHEALLPVLWHHRHRGVAALVSEAHDGEYLASLAAPLGYRLIRGSSSRGGSRALRQAFRALREGMPVGATPDGPRGPRRVFKPALLQAAARAGVSVLPVFAGARRGWYARSWDRFLVPAPFTTVRIAYGVPVMVQGMSPEAAEDGVLASLEDAIRLAAWPDAAATLTA
jgi:lysophospholipid acyltransferase (LPLAT)-like uncharacterized protein